MIGTCATEATLFLCADPAFGTMTEVQARQRAAMMAGPRGDAAIDLYKRLRPDDPPTYWVTSLVTDKGTWMDSIRLAERKHAQGAAPVYMYRLDWRTPVIGGAMRSPHGLDVPLVFDTVATKPLMLGGGPQPQQVANVMSTAWINFAKSGNPSQPGLAWPAYDTASRDTMIFDTASHTVSDPDHALRLFWNG
jgi:para-nitrobenzyl esterase